MKRAIAGLAMLLGVALGCGAAQVVPTSRALCYAAADLHAQARVDAECRIGDAGVPFAECPAHDEIMAQLRRNQERCP